MVKKLSNTLYGSICAVLIVQLMGCGTILYPERKGQKSGKIDAGVAVLDGLGLLLFLVPGIIAFAVDFHNGTIYLPGTSSSLDVEDIEQITFDPKITTLSDIEQLIEDHTGTSVRLNQSNMRIAELASTDEMVSQFQQIIPDAPGRMAFIQ